ncbi:MAG TPA: outer membrane beta-barrel protein [Gemmataceae bacterium]|nr:outer membrane beta-barrel protein [Gemmataceae bacterium]
MKAPPPAVPVVSWTGFYVSGGFGYAMWAADTRTIDPATGACVLCVEQTQGGKGWLGTVGIGYDYQFTNRIVGGVFADFDFSNIKGTIQDQGPFFAGRIKESRAWSVGPRAGWLFTPQTLGYVSAGYTRAHFSSANMVDTFTGTPTPFFTPAFDKGGWFVGTGTETTFSWFGPGWFWRTEYRYSYFGIKTLTDSTPGAGPGVAVPGIGFFANPQNSITFKPIVQAVRTELVYKFNWAGASRGAAWSEPTAIAPVRWSGVYVNGGIGYGLWAADTTTINPATGVCVLCVRQTQGGKGWLGTVGIGYDHQFTERIVGGLFLDADLSSIKGTIQDQIPFFAGKTKETWSWAVGPRVGWLWNPQTLSYVNAGYTQTHFDSASMVNTFTGVATGFATPAFDMSGWFIGGGLERSLTMFGLFGPGWFWRSEYRYASYGTKTLTDSAPGAGPIVVVPGPGGGRFRTRKIQSPSSPRCRPFAPSWSTSSTGRADALRLTRLESPGPPPGAFCAKLRQWRRPESGYHRGGLGSARRLPGL